MELELQILSGKTLNLADEILPIIKLYPRSRRIKPEFIQNTVEINSRVCNSVDELEADVSSIAVDLNTNCKKLGLKLCGAGTHPFSKRLGVITPLPRYLRLEKRAGLISHIQITYSTHVHLGMTSGHEAISTMTLLKPYIPLLTALSANSPFWRRHDTGYASYRHRILDASRTYGIPPYFKDWESFKSFFLAGCRSGMMETINDIHWDIRPRPHLGTVEVRVMDAQSSVKEAVMLATFIRVLARHLMKNPEAVMESKLPMKLPWWIEKENRFQASRLGIEARYIKDERGTYKTMREVWQKVIKKVAHSAVDSTEAAYLEALTERVDEGRLGYRVQRDEYDKTGSMRKVVSMLVRRLEDEGS